ncbi:hypothetical protein BV898_00471 [Hypsibius exemplaris]|uniref:G-protein coupled receptors family 1 profile domain-containing protein n=1 Tax=Hypsibius exemplaris TaxID=2072580 RepID=A0A1W0XDV7_HYPEX|nr:hypothetical protein BV898_00471 [Hypsibius exemplaris]
MEANQTPNSLNVTSRDLNQTNGPDMAVWVTFGIPLWNWYLTNLTICVAGALFNLLLIVAILGSRSHRRGSGCLIVNVVFIEFCMCAAHLPLNTIMTYQAQFHTFAGWVCPYVHFTFLWTQQAGHWSACFLALNRFVAFVFPHSYPRWTSRAAYIGMIAGAWTVGFVDNLFLALGFGGRYVFMPPWYSCGPRSDGRAVLPVVSAIGVYVPEGIQAALYIIIIVKVKIFSRSNRICIDVNNSSVAQARTVAHRRFSVVKILLVSSVWYILCYFPNTIIASTSLIRYFVRNPVLQLWMRTLFLCGYAVNPIFFFALSADYRIAAARPLSLLCVMMTRLKKR